MHTRHRRLTPPPYALGLGPSPRTSEQCAVGHRDGPRRRLAPLLGVAYLQRALVHRALLRAERGGDVTRRGGDRHARSQLLAQRSVLRAAWRALDICSGE